MAIRLRVEGKRAYFSDLFYDVRSRVLNSPTQQLHVWVVAHTHALRNKYVHGACVSFDAIFHSLALVH